jgi:hypothetical protein
MVRQSLFKGQSREINVLLQVFEIKIESALFIKYYNQTPFIS